jgi:mono/diheme cytochrome c family protein
VSAARDLLLSIALMLLATCGIAGAGGGDIFNAHCVICHQHNGDGVVGMYPPLADSIGAYAAIPAGRAYLVHVVSFGMTGPIAVHGQVYNGVMQAWPSLTDGDVADVLNFALVRFNAKLLPSNFKPLSRDEVKKYRTARTALGDVHKERDALMKALAAHHIGGS